MKFTILTVAGTLSVIVALAVLTSHRASWGQAGDPDETCGEEADGSLTRYEVLKLSSPVQSLSWSPNGTLIAVQTSVVAGEADRTRTTELWDVDRRELQTTISKTVEPTFSVTFSPDGQTVACAVWREFGIPASEARIPESEVRIWDIATGDQVKSLAMAPARGLGIPFSSDLLCMAYSPDGRMIAAGGKLVGRLGVDEEGRRFGVDEGTHIGGEVCVWDARAGQIKWSDREQHTDIVNAVAFSPDGKTLASAGKDKLIRLWEPETGTLKRTLVGASWDGIVSLAFSPDGKLLATGGTGREEGGMVRVWDVQSGRALHSFPAGVSRIASGFVRQSHPRVTFSLDGETLFATAAADDASPPNFQVRMWIPRTGEFKGILAEHRGAPTDTVVSPDGRWLAVGTYEGEVILIDVDKS